jgi:hypothetical protein
VTKASVAQATAEINPTSIQLSSIRLDGNTQPRAAINEQLVAEYATAIYGGATMPPVVVFFDGVTYWLADGFHRYHAHVKAQLISIRAEVRHGIRRDAILYSVGANAENGQRRSPADKKKAVISLLEDEEWVKWSDREIARRCAVSHEYVGQIRESLSTVDSEPASTERTVPTKHGGVTQMNVANIGKARKTESGKTIYGQRAEAAERFEERVANAFEGVSPNVTKALPKTRDADVIQNLTGSMAAMLPVIQSINPKVIATDVRAAQWIESLEEFTSSIRVLIRGLKENGGK